MERVTEKEILEFFPELETISNEVWRRKICEIWVEAFSASKWDDITKVPHSPHCPGISLINHTRSTTLGAIALLKILKEIFGTESDSDVLIAACLLHDVCRFLEYEPTSEGGSQPSMLGETFQHGFLSGYYAKLKGFPDSVVSIVIAHTCKSRAIPKSLEGIALYYADCAAADFQRFLAQAHLLMEDYK